LGVLRLKNGKDIVLADIPGLIEGASEGKGLGDEFLRHVERTRILVHIIDPMEKLEGDSDTGDYVQDVLKAYDLIRKELEDYGAGLGDKREIVVVNKLDLTEAREVFDQIREGFKKIGIELIGISAVSGEGLDELIRVVMKTLDEVPEKQVFEIKEPVKVYTIENLPNRRMVYGRREVLTADRTEG
jgi:GTP-binding protein